MVKLQPYKQQSLAKRLNYKLSKRYYGLCPIIARIEKIAYKLNLPVTSKIHHVFHISQLKPFYGSNIPTQIVNLPSTSDEMQSVKFPLAILNSRIVIAEDKLKTQVLVQWAGLPIEETY